MMYDVLHPTMMANTSVCKHGCAAWNSSSALAALFSDPAMLAAAGNSCAQPALGVDTHVWGAWCQCATGSSAPPPPPKADHPLDGKVFTLNNTYGGEDKFVSFAYTDAPPGASGGSYWLRAVYTSLSDAMPVSFHAVVGSPHVYTLRSEWPGYEGFVCATNDTSRWMHIERPPGMGTDAASDGCQSGFQARVLPASNAPDRYILQDASTGLYVSFCDGGCSGGRWLRADYSDAADAMTLKLDAAGPQGSFGYCTYAPSVPEQLNLQLGGSDAVVIAFVTTEPTPPTEPPVAEWTVRGGGAAAKPTTTKGSTHAHTSSEKDRTLYMHFVRLEPLPERATVEYRVRSGADGAAWSERTTFRAPYSSGVTTVDVFGDMGVYTYNAMGGLHSDCVQGTAADAIIHMGDHAYNEGEKDERRADGYMGAYARALAQCPWVPIVGNHEYYDGEELSRYLDSTWPSGGGGASTATSALGGLLSIGNYVGQGTAGTTPSHTSRYFSIDLGLLHLVALDLNGYYGLDPCGSKCVDAQKEWLAADLTAANANRDKVPWIVLMSHYPFYCTGCYSKEVASAWYVGDGAETVGNLNMSEAAKERMAKASGLNGCATASSDGAGVAQASSECPAELRSWGRSVGSSSNASIADLHPFLSKYGVDMYIAGHWHYYESLWPLCSSLSEDGCRTGNGGEPIQKSFVEPPTTVHVTTGNGGPPGADNFCEDPAACHRIPSTRKQSVDYGYGRISALNRTHLRYQQLLNKDGSTFDDFVVVRSRSRGTFGSGEVAG